MILGTGIDLVEVSRVRAAMERLGERFVDRILLAAEAEYCRGFADPAPHVAARFAAKEAVSKAFGTGIGAELGWHDVEVARRESGEPYVILRAGGLELMRRRGAKSLHLSISHTREHATAVAILEG